MCPQARPRSFLHPETSFELLPGIYTVRCLLFCASFYSRAPWHVTSRIVPKQCYNDTCYMRMPLRTPLSCASLTTKEAGSKKTTTTTSNNDLHDPCIHCGYMYYERKRVTNYAALETKDPFLDGRSTHRPTDRPTGIRRDTQADDSCAISCCLSFISYCI